MKKRLLLLILWPAAGLILLLCRSSEQFAEHVFARGIYPVYRTPISFAAGLIPCSLGELILYAAVPAALIGLIVWIKYADLDTPEEREALRDTSLSMDTFRAPPSKPSGGNSSSS